MKQILTIFALISIALAGVYIVLTVYDDTLTMGRMWETPAIRPYEKPMPSMAAGVVPFSGGEVLIRATLEAGEPSMDLESSFSLKQGERAYRSYCIHCHGKKMDGHGTVGQSFAPLPRDFADLSDEEMEAKRLFHIISYGFKRIPALSTTMSVEDRWAVVRYIREATKRNSNR